MCLPNAERRTTEAKPVEICRSDIGRTHGSAPTIGRVEHMRNLNWRIERLKFFWGVWNLLALSCSLLLALSTFYLLARFSCQLVARFSSQLLAQSCCQLLTLSSWNLNSGSAARNKEVQRGATLRDECSTFAVEIILHECTSWQVGELTRIGCECKPGKTPWRVWRQSLAVMLPLWSYKSELLTPKPKA